MSRHLHVQKYNRIVSSWLCSSHTDETDTRLNIDQTKNNDINLDGQELDSLESMWCQFGGVTEVLGDIHLMVEWLFCLFCGKF